MRLLLFIFLIILAFEPVFGKQKFMRRCKRTTTFADIVKKKMESNGCSKNVWLGMDRASKCPQLNGAVVPEILAMNATTIVETPVQPRLFGRRGVYNANCELMVIVVKRKGCTLLDTDSIEFECQDNTIFYKGHEVTSYVCALSVFPEFEMVM
uniref:RNAse_Pc domain-containing protein n=1 Tax=Caenorhabditis tropicalis TaxID=1561998 RepID=A0A1I7TB51_9PELO